MQIDGYPIEEWIAAFGTVLALFGSIAWGILISLTGRDMSQCLTFVLALVGLVTIMQKGLRLLFKLVCSGVGLVALGHALPILATIVR